VRAISLVNYDKSSLGGFLLLVLLITTGGKSQRVSRWDSAPTEVKQFVQYSSNFTSCSYSSTEMLDVKRLMNSWVSSEYTNV